MALVQKISFKADNTNLLQNFNTKNIPLQNTLQPQNTSSVSGDRNLKTSTYISSATALLALGVTTALAVKNYRMSKQIKSLSEKGTKLTEELSQKFRERLEEVEITFRGQMSEDIKKAEEKFDEKMISSVNEIHQRITDLGKWQDGQIDGVRNDLSSQISGIKTCVKTFGQEDITLAPVLVNGMQLNLASPLHGYGKHTEKLEKMLRSESMKRIIGMVDRSKLIPKDNITIRVPTSEFKGFSSTGGMSVVPKEIVANLGAIINGKQNARLIVDTPMYLGQVEDNVFYSLEKKANGIFDYMSSKSKTPIVKDIQKIDTMRLLIHTDKGKINEVVDVYLAKNLEQAVDIDLLKPWLDGDLKKELEIAIKDGGSFEINKNALTIKFTPEKGDLKPTARIKYDAVFYKNDKFNMDGPIFDGKTKNIYDNLTYESGETERFIYFDKYFYEHLLRNHESSTDKLGADLIIGNDWQTGGISAMIRLLTLAKKTFGLDPKIADEVYNIPIITLMHNAGLSGSIDHSQAKLLNIMFDEHAAMITKNAWMPRNAEFMPQSLNGLLCGDNLNPQTMAAVYSDIITPVSKGYGHEIASHSGFGGANHDIFRMRARYDQYSDIEHLKYLARQNELDFKLVPQVNMGYRPITNGCDRVNNMLTEKTAMSLEYAVGLKKGSLKMLPPDGNVTSWHLHNKEVYLDKVIEEIEMARNGVANPMNIALPELTNLTGVTKNTMVVSTAGRIVDQKGLDIFAEAIEEFLLRHPKEESPVFYIQGVGDKKYIDKILEIKKRVADKFGKKAAERIVYAKLFSELGRYDGCKLMSDFTVMSSWFEPCGLVHKEIAAYSGAIPIVNKVGGLTDGLKDGVNAVFSEFMPKFENYENALSANRKSFADALDKAYELFKDKQRFGQVLHNSYLADHSWLKYDGPMQQYAQALVDLKVLKPEVLIHS